MTSEIEQQRPWRPGAGTRSVRAELESLRLATPFEGDAAVQAQFVAAVEQSLTIHAAPAHDAHWHLHELACACDDAGEVLLARGRLEPGVAMLRLGLRVREKLASKLVADELFRSTVEISVELAASHFAIAQAYRRGGHPTEALAAMQAGIAAYRREIEAGGDPYALDTLAAHLEDAGRIAREIPERATMRTLIAESLALRERAAALAPEDTDLAREFVEACVWRTPDLGKASAYWLDRARRLLADREAGPFPVPGTPRLRNLVDTAGAPYLSN